jgi:hypothetical protein
MVRDGAANPARRLKLRKTRVFGDIDAKS